MPREQRILVHQIGSLGDTIVSMPALRLVRRKFGAEAQVTMLTQVSGSEIVKSADVLAGSGLVDEFVEYHLGGGKARLLKTLLGLWWRLLRGRYDVVVYLMESERKPKFVRRDDLFFKMCDIRSRLGFEAFSREYLYPRDSNGFPGVVPHEAVRRAGRLTKFGFDPLQEADLNDPFFEAPEEDRRKAQTWLAAKRKWPDRSLVGFCPASKMRAKLWPMDRFAEIGRRLLATGEYEIVIVGGPSDREVAETLIAEWGAGLNAAGNFSVLASAALLEQCAFVISVDTGPMHLAGASGVPCIALYSSVDWPGRFSPLGRNHVLLRHGDLPCAGCRLTDCKVSGHPCMIGIEVEQVWSAIEQMRAHVK